MCMVLQFTEFVSECNSRRHKKRTYQNLRTRVSIESYNKKNKGSCCPGFFTVPGLFDVQKVSVLDFMTDHQTPRRIGDHL